MEAEKVIGLRQNHLYIHEGFTLDNKPTFRIMWPLLQSEVEKRREKSSVMEYAWKTALPFERAKYTINQYVPKLLEDASTAGILFPGDDLMAREKTEKLVRSLPEDWKNLIRDYFDMNFRDDENPVHIKRMVTWTIVPYAGSVLHQDMDWDVLFDLIYWEALNDPERIKEIWLSPGKSNREDSRTIANG